MMLGFQEAILSEALASDGLTVLGRGLGLHNILEQLIRIYSAGDTAPAIAAADGGPQQALVFALNVGKNQQQQLEEDLAASSNAGRGHTLRFVNQEVGTAERAKVYLRGGCVIATAPILIVDLLNGRVDAKHISGLIVNDAHRVTDTSREAFIVRLFRTNNQTGFVKAFSDQPELLSGEFGKVEKILKSLFLRKLFLWPRFHLTVADSISAHNPEVIELLQPGTPLMVAIQRAIMDTMKACLAELRSAHSGDLAHLTIEDGISRFFDKSVRNQLRSIWNKVSKKTKQLVTDLGTLQRLLDYLYTYDCVTFLSYLEMLRVTEGRSCLWLLVDSASKIFQYAERRVYKLLKSTAGTGIPRQSRSRVTRGRGRRAKRARSGSYRSDFLAHTATPAAAAASVDSVEDYELQIVLEANPKWQLLLQVLDEIEEAQTRDKEQQQQQSEEHAAVEKVGAAAAMGALNRRSRPWLGTSTEPAPPVLVVGADERTCSQLSEVLDHIDRDVRGSESSAGPTERYLQMQFSRYILKKAASQGWQVAKAKQQFGANEVLEPENPDEQEHSASVAAVEVKEKALHHGQEAAEAEAAALESQTEEKEQPLSAEVVKQRAERMLLYQEARRYARRHGHANSNDRGGTAGDSCGKGGAASDFDEPDGSSPTFDADFGVLAAPHVLVHSLGTRWESERLLDSVKPVYVVLYDPDAAFVRSLEVFKAMHPGRPLRVYFLTYQDSVEEQRYRSAVRREKEAFESLIREKALMVLPERPVELAAEAQSQAAATAASSFASAPRDSRQGGVRARAAAAAGREQVVIVDTREFRSALPSILHSRNMRLVPLTLEVGDYILSPSIAVERKSIPDLYGSFASGRLYTQCDAMCRYYAVAVLLIEFDESKPFALQLTGANSRDAVKQGDLTSKLAVLLMHFPSLRLLWMRSPHAAADIFAALKAEEPQPDGPTAAAIGQNQGHGSFNESEYNWEPQEVLRRLPGINQSNIYRVMRSVENLAELAGKEEAELQSLLGGKTNGTKLFEFLRTPAPTSLL